MQAGPRPVQAGEDLRSAGGVARRSDDGVGLESSPVRQRDVAALERRDRRNHLDAPRTQLLEQTDIDGGRAAQPAHARGQALLRCG